EQPGVVVDGAADVDGGVFRVAARVARQLDLGHGLAGQLHVQQKRQDRMKERRRRQLDLAALRQLPVQRQDLPENVELPGEEPALFLFRELPAFFAQREQVRIALEAERMNPGQVEPDLQVAKVAFVEAA